MRTKTFFIITSCIIVTGICSCKKFVDIYPPPNMVESNIVFNNESSAVAAALGLYSKMISGNLSLFSGGTTIFTGLNSDEIINTATSATYDPYRNNSLLPNTGNLSSFWNNPYNLVYHANSLLEGLERSTIVSPAMKKQLRGEMLVSRSLIYFYLVNLFGDIPYVHSTDYRVNAQLPRVSKEEVFGYLIADLEEADTLLVAGYPSANRFRPNRFTAKALLARLYLYTGNDAKAEATSSAIIASGLYSLVLLPAVFTGSSSAETIWSLMRDNGNTHEGSFFVPASTTSRPLFQLTTQLLAAFEPNDQRKLITANGWLGRNTVSGIDYYYPNKYKLRTLTSGNAPTEFVIVFRVAEQYLIRAEARSNTGNPGGAIQDLNMVRVRAGLPSLSLSLTAAQVNAAIRQERRIEFFAEWGHRWFDLKRYGEANAVLGPVKGTNWQPTDQLYPIPQIELDRNPFLTQNPGY